MAEKEESYHRGGHFCGQRGTATQLHRRRWNGGEAATAAFGHSTAASSESLGLASSEASCGAAASETLGLPAPSEPSAPAATAQALCLPHQGAWDTVFVILGVAINAFVQALQEMTKSVVVGLCRCRRASYIDNLGKPIPPTEHILLNLVRLNRRTLSARNAQRG